MNHKLDRDDQQRVRSYLQNLSTFYGVHVIVRACMYCDLYLGVIDGEGEHGISHGLCPACEKAMREKHHLEAPAVVLGCGTGGERY